MGCRVGGYLAAGAAGAGDVRPAPGHAGCDPRLARSYLCGYLYCRPGGCGCCEMVYRGTAGDLPAERR